MRREGIAQGHQVWDIKVRCRLDLCQQSPKSQVWFHFQEHLAFHLQVGAGAEECRPGAAADIANSPLWMDTLEQG